MAACMESSKVSPNVKNYAMPRGRLSFAVMDCNGSTKGEVDLGNVTSLELTNGAVWKDHETSQEGVVVLDAKKMAAQRYTVKFTPDERSRELMAMFFLGDTDAIRVPDDAASNIIQSGSSVSKSFTIYLDRWIDLGFKYIKSGSLELDGNPITSTSGVRVDYENGLVMVTAANTMGIDDEDSVTVSFKYGTCNLLVTVPQMAPVVGFLRYRGTSEAGPRHQLEMWKVQVVPDASLSLIKPQDYANLSFTGDVYKDDDTGTHSDYPFCKITELTEATSYPS